MASVRKKEFVPRQSVVNFVGRRARSTMWALLISASVLLGFSIPSHAASTYAVIYSFIGTDTVTQFDGDLPMAGVVADSSGNLYGTTEVGGANDAGTVFQLTPPATSGAPWTETILFSFNGSTGTGANPFASLLASKKVTLYGTVTNGFTNAAGGVFSLTPPATTGGAWTETVPHVFATGGTDGLTPTANLIPGPLGLAFGTTSAGGTSGLGAVFALKRPTTAGGSWAEKVIHSFTGGPDGQAPASSLLAAGRLMYGTTPFGGAGTACNNGCGSVFALATPSSPGGPWTERVIYSFTAGSDGFKPSAALTIDKTGTIYGTAGGGAFGAGTVFSLTPPSSGHSAWTENTLYSFAGNSDGSDPDVGGLVIGSGGVLYGTTIGGGTEDFGTVFSLTPPATAGGLWTKTILHSFADGTDGADPLGGLLLSNGTLYGVTLFGGGSANCPTGCGTVFQVTL